jgi:DNA mismatch repair protein MutL
MSKIHVLDDHIANQIAAGEVVERPSSVVKELVENSIDAGSDKIDVSIEEGGLLSIRVQDNGSGIEAEDCNKAFFRHATSKISSGKDLFQIRSLGFRGEALPSIAAVSKLECVTCAQSDGLGKRIVIEGGTVTLTEETASSQGTDIHVRDLFYNTPARLKYMKTIQTELSHISDYMYRLSLAHPHISITLRHNGNVLLQTLGNNDLLQVIAAIYGSTIARNMVKVTGDSLDYQLNGYICKPDVTRANRFGISTIINGRYIRNYALVKAILNAYHTLLPINRFPIAVLSIQMDPSLVDVNVHPSKLEVRFSKERELLQFIEDELRKVLHQQVLIPKGGQGSTNNKVVIQEQIDLYPKQQKSEKAENIDFGETKTSGYSAPGSVPIEQPKQSQIRYEKKQPWNDSVQGTNQVKESMEHFVPQAGNSLKSLERSFPKLYPIGQMRGTYIIAQNEEGLYLIDQHAAHERVHYEYFYDKFGNPEEASQELLIPITLEFTPSEAEALKARLSIFEQSGVYMEYFGGNSFIVRSHPHWFPQGEEKNIIDEMAEWILSEKKTIDLAKLREKSSIMCSCKASIKANQNLSNKEIEALLDQLSQSRNPYTCPHGRPIVVSYSNYELEKMFKRA